MTGGCQSAVLLSSLQDSGVALVAGNDPVVGFHITMTYNRGTPTK